jgi:hypothetical protein
LHRRVQGAVQTGGIAVAGDDDGFRVQVGERLHAVVLADLRARLRSVGREPPDPTTRVEGAVQRVEDRTGVAAGQPAFRFVDPLG